MGLSVVWIAVGIAVWIAPGARRAGAGPRGTDRAIRIGTEKLMVKGSTVTFAQASGALLCSPSSPGCPASEWCAGGVTRGMQGCMSSSVHARIVFRTREGVRVRVRGPRTTTGRLYHSASPVGGPGPCQLRSAAPSRLAPAGDPKKAEIAQAMVPLAGALARGGG